MAEELEEFDEPDNRRPVVDADAVFELMQLHGTVKGLYDELGDVSTSSNKKLDKIDDVLNEIASTLSTIQSEMSIFLLAITRHLSDTCDAKALVLIVQRLDN